MVKPDELKHARNAHAMDMSVCGLNNLRHGIKFGRTRKHTTCPDCLDRIAKSIKRIGAMTMAEREAFYAKRTKARARFKP